VNTETRYKTVFQNAPSAGLPNQFSPNRLPAPPYAPPHAATDPDASPIDVPQVLNELYGKALDFSITPWSVSDPNNRVFEIFSARTSDYFPACSLADE
jgi:hypothetical protein